jgi:hypothetical protein
MDAGVVSGTLQPAPAPSLSELVVHRLHASGGKVPSTLQVTAARS